MPGEKQTDSQQSDAPGKATQPRKSTPANGSTVQFAGSASWASVAPTGGGHAARAAVDAPSSRTAKTMWARIDKAGAVYAAT